MSLVLLSLLGIGLAWGWGIAVLKQARLDWQSEQHAIEAISKLRGQVIIVYYPHVVWGFVFGDEPFGRVGCVIFERTQLTDESLGRLVRCLKECKQLNSMSFIQEPRLTGVGLEDLKGLDQLREVTVVGMPIRDSDVERLKGLSRLNMLTLKDTAITKQGTRRLQQALPHSIIHVE